MAVLVQKPGHVYEVEIGGVHLRLKSSHSEEAVNSIVNLVNSKIKEAMSLTKSDSLQTAAILACLNLAEEQFIFKKKALNELSEIESKTQEIVSNLESTQISQVEVSR